jgi:ribose transport system ATP-binding protein
MPAVECIGVSKQFDGVPVLRGASAKFLAGTVNILAGENGAGKSTLFKILAGQLVPDGGTISVCGERVTRFDPLVAQHLGISIIPQELLPIPDMRIYENLLIGRETYGNFGFLKRGQMIQQAREMLASVELDIDPSTPMRRLSIAATQLVEILKATSRNARIVLMDEPTSALSSRETEHLFRVIGQLKKRNGCILYTTHRMEEIRAIADTVAVLRDGQVIRQTPAAETNEQQIITDMVGREVVQLFPERKELGVKGAPMLVLRDFHVAGYPAPNSFELRRGEILGLAGLVGAGRSELLEAIYGIRHATGTIELDGVPLRLGHVPHSIERGLAMVPEDRKLAGILTSMSVLDNVTLPHLGSFCRWGGALENQKRRDKALKILDRTRVRYAHLGQEVGHLSGGNQQKIVLARWLITSSPKVLILDEPTRGIDVVARGELYRLIMELADNGVSILLASSDMPELLNLSHRVLVFRNGRVMGELSRCDLNQETILRLAMGVKREY